VIHSCDDEIPIIPFPCDKERQTTNVKSLRDVFRVVACVQDTLFLHRHTVDVFMKTFEQIDEKLMRIVLTAMP